MGECAIMKYHDVVRYRHVYVQNAKHEIDAFKNDALS